MRLPIQFLTVGRKLGEFLGRRRGLVLVILAAILAGAGALHSSLRRPPILAPAVHVVTGLTMNVLSRPLKLARLFTLTRGPSRRIMLLELELARLREAERENERLRSMVGYRPPPGFDPVPARITGLDLDPLQGVAWIDVGSGEGLRGDEPVLTVDGLIGIVAEVQGGSSRVRLLRNSDVAMSVRDTRTRELGIAEWDPGLGRFRVGTVPQRAQMAPGDTLTTSGLGGVFPPRLPVGRVAEIRETPDRLLKDVFVDPFATFFRLEEVFVLLPVAGPRLEDVSAPDSVAHSTSASPETPG